MKRIALTAMATALPGAALAHSGHAEVSGFASGLMHPVLGADHLLAMVAVGLIAAMNGGRMLWAMPLAFVGAMLFGAVVGLAGFAVPGVEFWILGSVIALGLMMAMQSPHVPQGLLLSGTALFGMFHGYAHGAEAPTTGSVAGYLIGFTVATATLHGIGIVIGKRLPTGLTRGAGMLIALIGASLAVIG